MRPIKPSLFKIEWPLPKAAVRVTLPRNNIAESKNKCLVPSLTYANVV